VGCRSALLRLNSSVDEACNSLPEFVVWQDHRRKNIPEAGKLSHEGANVVSLLRQTDPSARRKTNVVFLLLLSTRRQERVMPVGRSQPFTGSNAFVSAYAAIEVSYLGDRYLTLGNQVTCR